MRALLILFLPCIIIAYSTISHATSHTIGFDEDENGAQMPASVFPSGSYLINGELVFLEGNSYIEDGFEHNAIAFSNQEPGSHLHAGFNIATLNVASNLANDAGGGFFKQTNGGAFSLNSWDFVNLVTVTENELFDINPSLYNPAPESHLVVQGSLNGIEQFTLDFFDDSTPTGTFDFLTASNGSSANIDLLEYWWSGTGRGVIPLREHIQVDLEIDNVIVTTVPVPATCYLFFSTLLTLSGFSRRKLFSFATRR